MKNKSAITITLPSELVVALRKMFRTEGPVFDATNLRRAWTKAAPGILIHDLRRSGARNLRAAGVAETVIMQIGGWKTRSIFIRYAIVDTKNMGEAMEAVESRNASFIQAAKK